MYGPETDNAPEMRAVMRRERKRRMELAELLRLDWSELEKALRPILAEVLNPGPWSHSRSGVWAPGHRRLPEISEGQYAQMGAVCHRCGEPVYCDWGCPIPPVIAGSPEVVAERLRDEMIAGQSHREVFNAKLAAWKALGTPRQNECATCMDWFADYATPGQRILCCLLAMGKINEASD